MLARTALARLRAKVPTTAARDVAQLSRQLRTIFGRASSSNNANALVPLASAPLHRIRGYATATKTRASTAKKTPAKKKTATTKKAAAPKKKKPVPKKKVAKPKKKELTDEQKEKRKLRAAEQKKRDEIKELKALALQEPKQKPATAFLILLTESAPELKGKGNIGQVSKAVAEKYRNLSPAELERYNHQANQAAEENKKAFQEWLHRHTPLEIKTANHARRQLRLKVPSYRKGSIQDDRLVKQPSTAYLLFYKERYKSGDFKHMSTAEAARLAGKEWKALGASDKQKYLDIAVKDKQRYVREYRSTYGEEPLFLKESAQSSA